MLGEREALRQQQQQSADSVVFTRLFVPTAADSVKISNRREFFSRG
ncbi:hypothetical protein LI99_00565 [Mycolicibacterium smegmatis]|uniref:Uncharacterized protein n=1 Tax=Mycolicibacterium smegmatis (strain ATCC 700084 / mc(2)155) TaxID=246196 RepID=I7F4M9_MYCS2|nr:hypothetical protein MSMEI_0108 [Mycolicibacterium smegmatis MC2 155]AIU05393.1 hypothetical protein LJ00_00565 [Mycolicibacterium smegmatis MC2 155]AIU12018.1 hypothetical protein LI99_00565 [Mycolicibacterium smegmatis]AIU18642.1 hypothetical protein LI98_00565 [Mycolicibacterium smegmatis]